MNWGHPHEALLEDRLNPPLSNTDLASFGLKICFIRQPVHVRTCSPSCVSTSTFLLPPPPPITPLPPALPMRYGLCDFGHGFVVVWREGVSCWVLFVSRAWQTHAGTLWDWATNHSWNGYRHGVPMGFLYQVTSQNNIGQYFKWRNEGFRGCSQPGVWDSVWNSWTHSSVFDLHGRWAIKCMKHVGNTWGNSAWPAASLELAGHWVGWSSLPISQQDYA